jgi:hypothetical protein
MTEDNDKNDKNEIYVAILDDLAIYARAKFEFRDDDSFRLAITNAITFFEKNFNLIHKYIDIDETTIYSNLKQKKYVKWCRIEKYYCFVISMNGIRPHVWSKDCDIQVMDWNDIRWDYEGDKSEEYFNGEIVGSRPDDNVNENPVISLFNRLKIH